MFTYVFNECSHGGVFRFRDYFILRVLYTRKSSSLTSAINLLLDKDFDGLVTHLHALVNQVKDSFPIKLGVLRLIAINMQLNNEISHSHVAVLLSLIEKEDGLICAAYADFEVRPLLPLHS